MIKKLALLVLLLSLYTALGSSDTGELAIASGRALGIASSNYDRTSAIASTNTNAFTKNDGAAVATAGSQATSGEPCAAIGAAVGVAVGSAAAKDTTITASIESDMDAAIISGDATGSVNVAVIAGAETGGTLNTAAAADTIEVN